MNQDWQLLTTFFPAKWQELAIQAQVTKGSRKNKPVEDLLRVILMHVACGYSLRETVARAQKAGLANMSDVALLKRLRKCKEWLYNLCLELFIEFGITMNGVNNTANFRLFDATHVKEPGKTGSQWRIHYSFQVPNMQCDFFKITKTKGADVGEDLRQFPIEAGDYIIVDRGYSRASGIAYIVDKGAFVSVRVNTVALMLIDPADDEKFALVAKLQTITVSLQVGSWNVNTVTPEERKIKGRICAIRKTPEAIEKAHKNAKLEAARKGRKVREDTLFFAEYVIIFSTFPEETFTPEKILEWYRIRWQIELVFKRFKQITHMGHLPKYHDESAQAWLYGKLFIALVTEKIMRNSQAISPWGISPHLQSLARISIYVSSSHDGY
jgi:hypothetical protein